MRKIKIGKRLVLCFAFVLILLIASSGFSTYMMIKMSADTDDMFEYNVEPLYVLDDARLTNEIFDMWEDYRLLSVSILPSIDAGRDEEARALYTNHALIDLGDKLSASLTELFNYNLEVARNINHQQTKDSYTTIYILVAVTVVSVLATVMIATLLIKSITSPVNELKEAMNSMAGGDLNINIHSNMPDEIGDLIRYARRAPKMLVADKTDLSLAYMPGVAQPCLEIQKDINKSYELTGRWNTVAVITDGTAVLGLGDIGPEALIF